MLDGEDLYLDIGEGTPKMQMVKGRKNRKNTDFPQKGRARGGFHGSLERGGGEEAWLWTEPAQIFHMGQRILG